MDSDIRHTDSRGETVQPPDSGVPSTDNSYLCGLPLPIISFLTGNGNFSYLASRKSFFHAGDPYDRSVTPGPGLKRIEAPSLRLWRARDSESS